MCNIYDEETAFYSWKKVFFLVAYIEILIDFLFLEKKKSKTCSVDSYKSSIFKKDEEKQSKKFDCPVHQIQKSKTRQDFFTVYSFYIHGKLHTESCVVTKGKLMSDVNITSDLIRVEKYVDNNIQFFSSLMRSDMKNINRKVLWRFCMGRMFETLRQEKKFKMVLFGLSENNCHDYWFGSMWEIFKMESFKLYIP